MKSTESTLVFKGLGQSLKITTSQVNENGMVITRAETRTSSSIPGLPNINIQGELRSQMPQPALSALAASGVFDRKFYQGFVYAEEISGKTRTWREEGGQLIGDGGGILPLVDFFLDPLALIFNLATVVHRPHLQILAGKKIYDMGIEKTETNQVVLSVQNKKILAQLDVHGFQSAKCRLLPLLEFALHRLD